MPWSSAEHGSCREGAGSARCKSLRIVRDRISLDSCCDQEGGPSFPNAPSKFLPRLRVHSS